MRKFILGTDWFTDCDDVCALRVLTRAHKRGEIKLCGIAINACLPESYASVIGFLRSEGLDGEIPVGLDKDATYMDGSATYQKRLALLAPEVDNSMAPSALSIYRKVFAEEDEVDIIEIGFEQVIGAFIRSGADEYSPLTGKELMKEKCGRVWVMGGRWDKDGAAEYNFSDHIQTRKGANILCGECPVPVVFSGWEIGADPKFGKHIDHNDLLYGVMLDHHSENGRSAYDPLTVLLAITGDIEKAGYTAAAGKFSVNEENGECHFAADETAKDVYVIKKFPDEYYEMLVDEAAGINGTV